MKAMILVLTPEEGANLLNGNLSILVRKKFPKDFVGQVYAYVARDRNKILSYQVLPHVPKTSKGYNGFNDKDFDFQFMPLTKTDINNGWGWFVRNNSLNGKVIARFWCDKVEYIENTYDEFRWGEEDYNTETLNPDKLYEKSCLSFEEMDKYLQGDYGYAINITNLKPFEKPKELNEFNLWQDCGKCWHEEDCDCEKEHCFFCKTLTRAPRNGWCYVAEIQ